MMWQMRGDNVLKKLYLYLLKRYMRFKYCRGCKSKKCKYVMKIKDDKLYDTESSGN